MIPCHHYGDSMRIIAKSTLRRFWAANPQAQVPLERWYNYAKKANWKTPAHVRKYANSADFVGDRVIFNIGGNNYRLIVKIEYEFGDIYIRFVGTHEEYDRIEDVKAI